MNTSNFTNQSHPGLNGLLLLAAFPKLTVDPMNGLGAQWRLGQPGVVWLYSFAVLNNALYCTVNLLSF